MLSEKLEKREEEKRNNDSKLSLVTKEATEKEQKITNELNSLQEELLKLQKLHDLNLEKKLEIEQDYKEKLASQESSKREKEGKIDKLAKALSIINVENKQLQELQTQAEENRNELIVEHDKKLATMDLLIEKHNGIMESQADEISSLQEEIKQFYQSLKEEIEGKIESEKSFVHKVATLQESKKKVVEERDSLVNEIASVQKELDRMSDGFRSETKAKKILEGEIDSLKAKSKDKRKSISADLSAEIILLQEKTTRTLNFLFESEKKLRNELDDQLLEQKKGNPKRKSPSFSEL